MCVDVCVQWREGKERYDALHKSASEREAEAKKRYTHIITWHTAPEGLGEAHPHASIECVKCGQMV
jgi:hypothetical protein